MTNNITNNRPRGQIGPVIVANTTHPDNAINTLPIIGRPQPGYVADRPALMLFFFCLTCVARLLLCFGYAIAKGKISTPLMIVKPKFYLRLNLNSIHTGHSSISNLNPNINSCGCCFGSALLYEVEQNQKAWKKLIDSIILYSPLILLFIALLLTYIVWYGNAYPLKKLSKTNILALTLLNA